MRKKGQIRSRIKKPEQVQHRREDQGFVVKMGKQGEPVPQSFSKKQAE